MEILIILSLVAVAYHKTVNFGLVVDDIRHAKEVNDGYLEDLSWHETIRRRLYGVGTLAKNRKINLTHEHLLSTAIHGLICVLIYLAFGSNQVSLCASLLYAINPANNQTSIWLNGRRYAVNIVCVLLMILAGPAGLVLYPLTALLQPSAVFAPILYGWIGIFALPVFYLIAGQTIQERIKGRLEAIHTEDMTSLTPKKIIPIVKIYGAYWAKMLFPGKTLFIYPFMHFWGVTAEGNKDAYAINKDFFVGLGSVIASIAGFLIVPNDLKMYWVLMCLATFQWSGVISVTQIFADRYISLPNVFMMVFVSHFTHQYLGANALTGLLALGVYYFVNLQQTLPMYKTIYDFWAYHNYFYPENVKFREFKATYLIRMKDPMGAWECVKEGLKYNPTDYKLNLLAANCMNIMEDKQSVLAYLKIAKKCCYIGQEFVFKDTCKGIFGFDLEEENAKIKAKVSDLKPAYRENVRKLHELVNA